MGFVVSFARYAKWYDSLAAAESSADYTAKYSAGKSVQIYSQDNDGELTHIKTVRVKKWNER